MSLRARAKETDLTAGRLDSLSLAEGFASKRHTMQAVVHLAKDIAQSHQDDFSVDAVNNDSLSSIHARTAFEAQGSHLILSLGITKWKNSTVTQEVNIRPEHGSWMDDDAISYRLDVETGQKIREEYDRFAADDTSPTDDEKTLKIKREIRDVMLSFFDTIENGDLARYADSYAETTIKTEGAVWVLRAGRKFHRPRTFGFTSGPSLRQFRQWVEERQAKGDRIVGLLE